MESQKIISLAVNTPNEPSKSRTNHWVEINFRETYKTNSQNKFKASMVKSRLCNDSET